jgi:hypothetical protein
MSRRIDTGHGPGLEANRPQSQTDGEGYLGRLAKYIPAEIIGLYLTTSGVIPNRADGTTRWLPIWIVFVLNALLVPVFFYFATSSDKKTPLWPQIILASIAFPVWVFAIGGPFRYFDWYQSWIAALLLSFVTVVFGFYKPALGS